MNLCQAVVQPDCSKAKVTMSTGVQKAILKFMEITQSRVTVQSHHPSLSDVEGDVAGPVTSFGADETNNIPSGEVEAVILAVKTIPSAITKNIKVVTVEFAGVKFKAKVVSV